MFGLLTNFHRCDAFVQTHNVISSTETTNIALDKQAFQSSTVSIGSASKGVDGDTNGAYVAGSCTHTDKGGEVRPWWAVDLGIATSVFEVEISNRLDADEKCVYRSNMLT